MRLQNKVVFTTRQDKALLPVNSSKNHLYPDGGTLVLHTGEGKN